MVARQFVERLARQRRITLPTGDIFAETPVGKGGGKKPALAKKGEPPKPAAPALPPPRLVKTHRPAPVVATGAAPEVVEAEPHAPPEPAVAVSESPSPPVPVVEEPVAPEPVAEPEVAELTAPVAEIETPTVAAPETEPITTVAAAAVAPSPESAPAAKPSPGRLVPQRLRLRIEEERPTTPMPPLPSTPAPRIVRPQPPRSSVVVPPPAARPAVSPSGAPMSARTGTPSAPSGRPLPPRPSFPAGPSPSVRPPIGGPRPLPSPPVRPSQPAPGPGARPMQPSYPPRPALPGRPPAGFRPLPGSTRQAPPVARRDQAPRPPVMLQPTGPPPVTRTISLAEGITVKDLADKLDVRVKDVLAKLLMKRLMMTINATLDTETATMLAREFGAEVQMRSFEEELIQTNAEDVRKEDIVLRAPVVTVMGHVDHGKTSLLDAIREARVAEREAGGITQHIGAYHVTVNGRNIVFLDTPGHEAFTLMRARGAKVTDIVILVVAADDGVMPQTKEAIDHARAANVPIIVAINKIDKPGSNPERVKRELTELDLMPEDWGGKTVTVEVSAKKNQNLDLLLEMVLLVSEILELKANPKRHASGTVLESKLDKGRGPVATVLVQNGTLSVGDTFIAGPIVGRVRALIDDRGRPTKAAQPSTPVEVLGLTGLPQPGDVFQVADAAKARQIAAFRGEQAKNRALGAKGARLTLESLQAQIAEGGVKELCIIIKADVQGSAEVLADTLVKLSDDKVKVRIIHAGVGAINESDVLLASASKAIIIAFNVRPDRNAEDIASREGIDIRLHSVIYNVTDEMKKAMAGLLEPTFKEVRIGTAEIRNVFKVPKFGSIAGCLVVEGRITRASETKARLLRDNVVVYEGNIGSLRRFKDDVSEVRSGLECGIGFERFNDLKVGDKIEVFTMERVATPA
ncbi:MAG: translation initiation factor IF-2 [Acidimicrobiia bacterium]|nr:translation initiation factor IF-2 [Acidimicrobiia bacterium]